MSNVLSGVFAYAKVTEPANKYQSEEKEFSIDIIVDKATYKAFGKQFPKQKGKTVDNEDFKTIYKIDPPFPDQDEQCILKLKKAAQYKDGTMLAKQYWPRLLQKVNGKAVPLAEGVLIANGSKGKVSFDVTENSYGTFAKLKAVLVEELIKYEKADGDAASDFGLETDYSGGDFADTDSGSKTQVPTKAVAAASKSKKVVHHSDEEEEEDTPF
jgi:hypothetical protein